MIGIDSVWQQLVLETKLQAFWSCAHHLWGDVIMCLSGATPGRYLPRQRRDWFRRETGVPCCMRTRSWKGHQGGCQPAAKTDMSQNDWCQYSGPWTGVCQIAFLDTARVREFRFPFYQDGATYPVKQSQGCAALLWVRVCWSRNKRKKRIEVEAKRWGRGNNCSWARVTL